MPDIFVASKKALKFASINRHHQVPGVKHLHQPKNHASPGLFSTFIKSPHKFHFVHQDPDEHILLFTRRHFATNYIWIAFTFLALILPPLLLTFLQSQTILQLTISPAFIAVLLCFYYLIIIGFAFYNFVDWFYNIGIITEKRIMDIDFMHLSYIDIAITQLPEVEDVIHRQKGFLASFLNYGDIVAHTVAGKEDFVFEKIPHPAQVVDLMSKLIADK